MVSGGIKTPLESIEISGTPQVGAELNAVLVPNEATATYEWQRSDGTGDMYLADRKGNKLTTWDGKYLVVESGGQYTAIPLATEKTYTLAPEDESKFIKVKAVGNGNYTGTVTSSATNQITSL